MLRTGPLAAHLTPRNLLGIAAALFFLLQTLSGGTQHAAERELLLRAYEEQPQSRLSPNPLCLGRLQLERDLEGEHATADVPAGGGLRQEEESIDADELAKGQFERMPRIGARGFGPSVLFHDVFAGGFTGDFSLSKGKLMRRLPGSHILYPRPMPSCQVSIPADVATLPAACDRQAAQVTGHGQGYVSIGRVVNQLLVRMPDRDVFRMGPRWATCALVGDEAAASADGAAAALIDAAEGVIRVGLPGAEAAGRRTTVRVLGPSDVDRLIDFEHPLPAEVSRSLERKKDGTMGSAFNKPGLVRHATLLVAQSEKALNGSMRWLKAHPSAGAVVADPDFAQHALDAHAGTQPSGAFFALLLAAERCERVLLFGWACGAGERAAGGAGMLVQEEERLARALLARNAHTFAFHQPA